MANENPYITEFRTYNNSVLQGIEKTTSSLLDIKKLGIKLRSKGIEFTGADKEAIEVMVAEVASEISRMNNILMGI